MHILNSMHINANTQQVLEALVKNRNTHKTIVAEARVGYAKKAREALLDQLHKLESGKIAVVSFRLTAPQDHTKVYDTAIKMLEMHTAETITLDSHQVRTLMMDEWDWKSHFLLSNSMYSETAASSSPSSDHDE